MQTLHIQLENRSYPIYIGEGLLSQIKLIESHLKQKHVAVVTNTTVAPLYLDPLLTLLKQHGIKAFPIILPDGESYKNQETLNLIYDALLKEKCERTVTLIALGGGVIGDMTGYAAATYLRGVPFIQIPTTLLSQVDSSVGGKTGINHPMGKNMIGAFYQPQCVIADIDTLKTLPESVEKEIIFPSFFTTPLFLSSHSPRRTLILFSFTKFSKTFSATCGSNSHIVRNSPSIATVP